jgi:nucleoside-diphosphate-sugar epimerase
MRILITGGAGYLGNIVVRKLLAEGHQVKVFDTFFFGRDSLRNIEDKIELIKGDIRHFDQFADSLRGVDAVINLAAFSNDPTAEANPKANMEINSEGTKMVALVSKQSGVRRFIQASSCSIYYTNDPNDEMKTEETPVNPTAPYSLTKRLAEKHLIDMTDDNFSPVMLRQATVFGFSPRMRYDLVVNTFCKAAYTTGRLTVNSGGEMWRPLIHIADIADAYIACLNAPEDKIKGQIFNLSHKNYRVIELAHWIKEVLKTKKQIEVDAKYDDLSARDRSYRVSTDKMKNVLGFEAKRGVTDAVNEIWDYLEKGEYTDFGNPKYYNIKWMELGNIY